MNHFVILLLIVIAFLLIWVLISAAFVQKSYNKTIEGTKKPKMSYSKAIKAIFTDTKNNEDSISIGAGITLLILFISTIIAIPVSVKMLEKNKK